jgi:hypothetical protein
MFTTSMVAIEMVATIAAITAGFRRTPSILVDASVSAEFGFDMTTSGYAKGPRQLARTSDNSLAGLRRPSACYARASRFSRILGPDSGRNLHCVFSAVFKIGRLVIAYQ